MVTACWLTDVLQFNGIDAQIEGFTTREIGTGQVGRNVRFTLDYQRGTGPASIVGKFASQDPTSRATGVSQNNYFKEVMFYNTILPTVGIRAPRPLYAEIDASTHAFCLMLEDITPSTQGDQLTGCSTDMAALAMVEAAKLHAPRWNDPGLDDIAWLRPNATHTPDFFKALASAVSWFHGAVPRPVANTTSRPLASFHQQAGWLGHGSARSRIIRAR